MRGGEKEAFHFRCTAVRRNLWRAQQTVCIARPAHTHFNGQNKCVRERNSIATLERITDHYWRCCRRCCCCCCPTGPPWNERSGDTKLGFASGGLVACRGAIVASWSCAIRWGRVVRSSGPRRRRDDDDVERTLTRRARRASESFLFAYGRFVRAPDRARARARPFGRAQFRREPAASDGGCAGRTTGRRSGRAGGHWRAPELGR